MSATSTQPTTGHANQTAPLGALAILVGAIALGAVGIALGTSYKPAPDAGVRTDPQAALYAQRMGEKAPLFSVEEVLHAQRMGEKAPLFSAQDSLLIQRLGEYRDKVVRGFPSAVSGPATGSQRGLTPTDDNAVEPAGRSRHIRR